MRLTRGSLRALLAGALLLLACARLQADAREALQRAAALVRQGRLEEAEVQARLALADPETQAVACSVLGTIRFQQRRLDESASLLEKAVALDPSLVGAHLSLAQIYTLTGQAARALDTYDRVLDRQPEAIVVLRQAAVLAEAQQSLERSLSYWLRAKKLTPDDPDVLLGFGRVCLRMDLLEDAEPALTRAAALKPDDPASQYTLAAAKVGRRDFDGARVLLERLVSRTPGDAQLQYALGAVFYTQGRLDDAVVCLRESLRLQPDQLASQHYLALVARDQSRPADAIAILEKLVERYPGHTASWEVLGTLLMSERRYPDAERALREAVRLDPEAVKPNYQLGLLLVRMGRKDEADQQLARTKTLRQEDAASARLQLRLLDPNP